MSGELSQPPITIANASGFPLQIGVDNIVNKSSRWTVLLEEHPWRSDGSGLEGFIDIVAINRLSELETMVIECKRVRQAAWVFLVPTVSPSLRSRATVFGSQLADSKWRHYGWEDWQAEPRTYQSEYCAIPGQEQGRKNLIERTAYELASSVEALANQERLMQQQMGAKSFSRVYIPVIVTTAQLFVASFEPTDVSLADGCLPKDLHCSEVPFIRYRKSLAFGAESESRSSNSIQELHAETERTIFVVNALKLQDFLDQYEFQE